MTDIHTQESLRDLIRDRTAQAQRCKRQMDLATSTLGRRTFRLLFEAALRVLAGLESDLRRLEGAK